MLGEISSTLILNRHPRWCQCWCHLEQTTWSVNVMHNNNHLDLNTENELESSQLTTWETNIVNFGVLAAARV